MDAAQNFKKSALFLAIALSVAVPASAALTVNGQSTATVTIGSSAAGTSVSVGPLSSPISFTVTPATSSWFTVTPTSGTTPQSLTITPSGFAGQCGSVPANCPDTNLTVKNTADSTDTATITVKFSGSGGSGSGSLTASTSQLTLSAPSGSLTSGGVSVSAISNTNFSATVGTTSCSGGWLTLANGLTTLTALTTPYTVTVYANAGSPYVITNGTSCTGTLTLTPANGGTSTTVGITFNVTSSSTTTGTLFASSNNLNFAYPSGTQNQCINIGTNNASVANFNATISSTNNWLMFNNGTYSLSFQPIGTNALCLAVNTGIAAGLGTGAYSATITLTNPYNLSDVTTVAGTLSVNGGTSTTSASGAAPTALAFSYQIGGQQPPDQLVTVNGTGTISITSLQPSGNLFYSVNAVNGTAPGQVEVHVIPPSTVGSYNGSFLVSTSGGFSQTISVSLNVTASGAPVLIANSGGLGNLTCNYTVGVSGASQCNNSLSLTASDNTTSIGIAVTSNQSWVVPTCTGTTTPANCAITINPTALPNGVNTASLTIAATGAQNNPLTVPVVVLVSGSSSNNGVLTLGTSTLTLNPAAGSSQSQQLSVSASTVTTFNASANQGSCTGGTTPNWLSVSPAGSMNTPQTLTVMANAAGLTNATTCNGSVALSVNGVIQTVLVTMNVGASSTSTLTINPSSLQAFTFQAGGAAPASQAFTINSGTTATTPFTATVTGGGACSALALTPTVGSTFNTPQSFILNLATSGLTTAGNSTCTLTFTPTNGGTALSVPVAVNVSAPVTVTASPTLLTFTYQSGGQTPASQSITVDGGSGLTFSATASSSGNWLSVTPASGTTPATLTVSVNPSSLNPSTTPYAGTITVAGTGSATGSTTINVSVTVSAPLPTISSVANGASFASGSISPGEIFTAFGSGLGPTPAAGLALNPDGTVSTNIGGVQVFVNGTAAPLIYVSGTQVSAVVPYEIAPFKSASIVLKYGGQSSNGVTVPVASSQPGIFTLNSSGTGPGAIINQGGSVNSPSNAAHAGDTVVIYMTGEGQTVPLGVTGKVTTANLPVPQVTPAPALAVGVTIDGQPARVVYAGEAPGFVSGVMQVNVQIPANARAADLPLVVSVGGTPSQSGVTVSVR